MRLIQAKTNGFLSEASSFILPSSSYTQYSLFHGAGNNRSIELCVFGGRCGSCYTTRQTKIYSTATHFQLTNKPVNQND